MMDTLTTYFIVDREPPVLDSTLPPPRGSTTDTMPVVALFIRDAVSGVDSTAIVVSVNGDTLRLPSSALEWDGYELTFFAESLGLVFHDGDTFRFCVTAGDSPDLCDPNLLDTCFTIYIGAVGPLPSVIVPLPGDYEPCRGGLVRIVYYDEDGLLYDSLGVIWDGDTLLAVDSPVGLVVHGDTVEYSSPTPLSPGETLWVVPFALDSLHNRCRNSDSIAVVIDTLSPVVISLLPAQDSTVYDWYQSIRVVASDSFAGTSDSLWSMVVTSGGISHFVASDSLGAVVSGDTFSYMTAEPLRERDSVFITAYFGDRAVGCGANMDSVVWSFYIGDDDTLPPTVSFVPCISRAGETHSLRFIVSDTSGVWSFPMLWYSIGGLVDSVSLSALSADTFATPPMGPYSFGDTLVMVVHSCDADTEFSDISDRSCGVSDTFLLPILDNLPPHIEIISPQGYFSCAAGTVFIRLVDPDGVVMDSVYVRINGAYAPFDVGGDTLSIAVSGLSHLDTVSLTVGGAFDSTGNRMADTTFDFVVDLEPPHFVLTYPADVGMILVDKQIGFVIDDSPAGVLYDSLSFDVPGAIVRSGDTFTVSVDYSGDTVWLSIADIMDRADGCGHNRAADTTLWFIMPMSFECAGEPSPFTPNGDEFNPVVNFRFPDMDTKGGMVEVFTLSGDKVWGKAIAPGARFSAFWNGRCENGKIALPGVYIYIVEQDGKIICKGTVVLAR